MYMLVHMGLKHVYSSSSLFFFFDFGLSEKVTAFV
jgi:hypothetical protein